jgi:hypothetical protein
MSSSLLRRGIVLSLALLSAAAPAHAQDTAAAKPSKWRPFKLVYAPAPSIAKDCPSEEAFRWMVMQLTRGEDPFQDSAAETIRVSLERHAPQYRASTVVEHADGTRTPPEEEDRPTCRDAARGASETAYLIVKPFGVPPQTEPAAPPDPAPPAPAPSPPPAPAASGPAPPLTRPVDPPPSPTNNMDVTIALSASALITAGYTANVGPAFQIGGQVRGSRFSLGLELRGVLPGVVYARERADPKSQVNPTPVAFDLSQLSALLVPCVRFATYFSGCGVVQGGLVITQDQITAVYPQFSIGPRFGVEVPLGERLALFGFGEALFAPHDVFQGYREANVVWHQSIVSGFFGAGLSIMFQ